MSAHTARHFSTVTPLRHHLVGGGERRLMLGLTARHVRLDRSEFTAAPAEFSPSGLRRASSLVDRLQSPLTRYRD